MCDEPPVWNRRLFHFSDASDIATFVPRPVEVPSPRRPGFDWLNGPLVWAVDEAHAFAYLFPRDCPRVLLWDLPSATAADRTRWLGPGGGPVAHVESGWLGHIAGGIHRYELPADGFEPLPPPNEWTAVCRHPVAPLTVTHIGDVRAALASAGVTLVVNDRLDALLEVGDPWASTVHASGIRLRNASGWVYPPA